MRSKYVGFFKNNYGISKICLHGISLWGQVFVDYFRFHFRDWSMHLHVASIENTELGELSQNCD